MTHKFFNLLNASELFRETLDDMRQAIEESNKTVEEVASALNVDAQTLDLALNDLNQMTFYLYTELAAYLEMRADLRLYNPNGTEDILEVRIPDNLKNDQGKIVDEDGQVFDVEDLINHWESEGLQVTYRN